jgi:metal-dependent amidase/aminoacylase/carboxypeptidase family protein
VQRADAQTRFHPADRDMLGNGSLSSNWVVCDFHGKPSHAAISPWNGNSALSAMIASFTMVDQQRLHFRDGSRVHGFITNGGQAVNIIPEHTSCTFGVRSLNDEWLAEVQERVERCVRAAAMAHNVDVKITIE